MLFAILFALDLSIIFTPFGVSTTEIVFLGAPTPKTHS